METTGKTVNIPQLEISPAERTEEKLTPESVAAAARLLRETGLVVIESVLPRDWIAELNVAMQTVLDNEAGAQNGEHPMLKMPFMDARIINNPFAMPILKAAMGEKVFAYLPYGCNHYCPRLRHATHPSRFRTTLPRTAVRAARFDDCREHPACRFYGGKRRNRGMARHASHR